MNKLYYFSMYALFALVFSNEAFNISENLFTFLSTLLICILLFSSLFLTRGFQLYISIISLIIGHLILWKYHLGFEIWFNSFAKSFGIPVLFVAIPLISFPIKYGNYLQSLQNYLTLNYNHPILLFCKLAIIHLALSIALNIGSIPTMQNLLKNVKLPQKYLARLYTAGYSSYMVFSPYDGVVNMVLLFTSVNYADYFFSGSCMVFAIITISGLLIRLDKNLLQQINHSFLKIKSNGKDKKLYELLTHIFLLIFFAFLGNKYLPLSNQLYTIALIIILYSSIWGYLLHILKEYKYEAKKYSENLLSFKTFIPFLLSTSFLGSLISYTPLKVNISEILILLNSLPSFFIVQLFILLTIVLSLLGIHMMITVTTLALTISPELLGLSNIAYALTLLSCWYAAMSASPFIPYNIIVADTIEERPLNVAFKYNLPFSLVVLIAAPLIIIGINMITK